MRDLIERLEKATGPDRELDARIWCAVFAPEGAYVEKSRFNGEWCIYYGKSVRSGEPRIWEAKNSRVRPITESIDAALTLRPDGFTFYVDSGTNNEGTECHACVWHPNPDNRRTSGGGRHATSPAIALCIAALRARCSLTPPERSGS